MKLLFLILFSVFTIESALASPNPLNWCRDSLSKIKNSFTTTLHKYQKIQKKQLALIENLNSENNMSYNKYEIIEYLSKIENPVEQVEPLMIQELEGIYAVRHKFALEFLKNQKGNQVIEIYRKLLHKPLSQITEEKLIKQILETQEPEIAKTLFQEALPKALSSWTKENLGEALAEVENSLMVSEFVSKLDFTPADEKALMITKILEDFSTAEKFLAQALKTAQYSWTQKSLIEALLIAAGEHPQHETQLALVNLYNSKDTEPEVTAVNELIIEFLIEIKKPLPEVVQLIMKSQKMIEQIIKEETVAEKFLTQALKTTQDSWTQGSLITALEDVAGEHPQHETQLALVNLYNSKDVEIKNPSPEVIQIMKRISKDDSSPYQKEALEFLEKHKEK